MSDDRVALARAALAAAEERTGARKVSLVGQQGGASSLTTRERPPLLVPSALAPLLPEGLRRGTTTTVLGSTWLVLGILAHALVDGTWGAAVGHRDLGLLAAAKAGVPLDRLALIPAPGDRAVEVVAALADGMGAVLVGPQAGVPDADARRITARVRDRGAVLLTTTPWPGAHIVLQASSVRWEGVGTDGGGRVRRGRTSVVRHGRPGAPVDLTLPLPRPGQDEVPAQLGTQLRRAG